MFGHLQFADINERINHVLSTRRPAIAAHRGISRGAVPENTRSAVIAAVRGGADVAEIDVVQSLDGVFFAFHDGYERSRLGMDESLTHMAAAKIEQLTYTDYPGVNFGKVERIGDIFSNAPNILFNIDRSWRYWGGFLDWLDAFEMHGQTILKSIPSEDYLTLLRRHNVKYPYMAMVSAPKQLSACLDDPDINCIGAELLVSDPTALNRSRNWIKQIHESGLFVFVNALDLGNGVPGFVGLNDTDSVIIDPEIGWGKLIDLEVDIIQTDWPEILNKFIAERPKNGR